MTGLVSGSEDPDLHTSHGVDRKRRRGEREGGGGRLYGAVWPPQLPPPTPLALEA